MKPEIRPGQIWRHFKGGVYRVLYLAKHSETGEELVTYTSDDGDGTVWARPASMWLETVEHDGKRAEVRADLQFSERKLLRGLSLVRRRISVLLPPRQSFL